MSKARARTGLPRPRETERELLDARWRENGGPKANGSPAYLRNDDAATLRMAAAFHGIEPMPLPEMNECERVLGMLQIVSGDEIGEGIFAQARATMKAMGYGGAAGLEKLHADLPVGDADLAIHRKVSEAKMAGMSEESAIELATASLGVPAASFDGACQQVKRRLYRMRKLPPDALVRRSFRAPF